MKNYLKDESLKIPDPILTIDDIINKNATILQAQIDEIQKIDEKLNAIKPKINDLENINQPTIVVHNDDTVAPEDTSKYDNFSTDNFYDNLDESENVSNHHSGNNYLKKSPRKVASKIPAKKGANRINQQSSTLRPVCYQYTLMSV